MAVDRTDLPDLAAFLVVSEERSFTRAAAKLGVSQSALSHTMRRLEAKMGVRLLTRTTRSVSPTEAGERLVAVIGPALDQIHAGIGEITRMRERPAGNIRITASEHAARSLLWPALTRILPLYPDIHVEVSINNGFVDIVEERFDAGIRLGEAIARDMIAVRIGPALRMACVGSPDYFARHPKPQTPQDLAQHNCINLRLPSSGGLYAWEFEKDGRVMNVRVEGQLTFGGSGMLMQAAEAGMGLIMTIDDMVHEGVASGRLVRVLEDWCPPFAGYHLYYPSRRQASPAFALLVDALRYRG
ncbi:LysR family transcriptional regulator [Novosphingobium humi]|uniref:LysR family transcriptional regulator n=1 Tax=Novosphingobium humi TaxID=2282397 RepID=A0ABY7TYN5_9SPHN|nr:LysR family transcriptional regulator [Novosphingobium humi]WCT77219.1 LysR family transcriptional regulator [Novosphingobium humi]